METEGYMCGNGTRRTGETVTTPPKREGFRGEDDDLITFTTNEITTRHPPRVTVSRRLEPYTAAGSCRRVRSLREPPPHRTWGRGERRGK